MGTVRFEMSDFNQTSDNRCVCVCVCLGGGGWGNAYALMCICNDAFPNAYVMSLLNCRMIFE